MANLEHVFDLTKGLLRHDRPHLWAHRRVQGGVDFADRRDKEVGAGLEHERWMVGEGGGGDAGGEALSRVVGEEGDVVHGDGHEGMAGVVSDQK